MMVKGINDTKDGRMREIREKNKRIKKDLEV